jgi:Domain of unknown function (DUF2017)
MARGFRRTRHGYRCRLDREEAFVLRRLAIELEALIEAEAGGSPRPADELEAMLRVPSEPPPRSPDPVIARLFPDAYDDAEEAAEFRRFTQLELAGGKRAALAVLRATIDEDGGDVTLDEEGAQLWLTALNDLRLALGERVGITEDNVDELARLADDDPRGILYNVYELLTFLQGTLVEAVAGW